MLVRRHNWRDNEPNGNKFKSLIVGEILWPHDEFAPFIGIIGSSFSFYNLFGPNNIIKRKKGKVPSMILQQSLKLNRHGITQFKMFESLNA